MSVEEEKRNKLKGSLRKRRLRLRTQKGTVFHMQETSIYNNDNESVEGVHWAGQPEGT